MGIACPYCGSMDKTLVTDKRNTGYFIRRRRMCKVCGRKFGTYEMRSDEVQKIRHSNIKPRRIDNEHRDG